MRLLRALLLVTAAASLGFAVALVLVPGVLGDLAMAPEEMAWVRYLVPIYLGLAIAAWWAYRDPARSIGVTWGLVVVWAGLVIAHLVSAAAGDEAVGATFFGLVAFDAAMALGLGYGNFRVNRARRVRALVGAALAMVGVAVLVAIWSQSGEPSGSATEPTEDSAVPERVTAGDAYPNPAEAAEARAEASGVADARADSFVLIVANETTVHLRVRVTGSNDCLWFGVVGRVDDDALGWSSAGPGDGQPCD